MKKIMINDSQEKSTICILLLIDVSFVDQQHSIQNAGDQSHQFLKKVLH